MKKTFTSIIIIYLFNGLIAQPTITNSWAPTTGIIYKSNGLDGTFGLSEGNSGANETWDFSSEDTLSSSQVSYINPSSAPSSSSFPGATDVLSSLSVNGNATYNFNKLVGNTYQLIGVYQPSNNYIIDYTSNPLDFYLFPMTMNSTFNDIFSATGSYSVSGQSGVLNRNGTIDVVVDGYGTLITHYGTYSNVLRVKSIQDMTDTVTSNGVQSIFTYHYETYAWISSAYRGIVLASVTHLETNGISQDFGYVSQVISTGIDEQTDLSLFNLTVSPLPATSNITLSYSLTHKTKLDIEVYNELGQIIYSAKEVLSEVGEQKKSIPVESWSNGKYFVHIKTDKGLTTKQITVQR